MSADKFREENAALLRLGQLLKPYLGRLMLALVMLIGLTAVNIVVPQLIGMVFNDVFPHRNWTLLWGILISILGLYIIRNLLYYFSKYAAVQVGEDVCFELRSNLFERLQQMNLQYYRANKPGSLSSRVMNDSFVIQQFIQDVLPTLLQALLLFLGIIAVIFAMNWKLALAATVVLPLHLAAFHYFKRPIKDASKTAQEQLALATGNLIEKFLGIEVVKGFTGEQRESAAFQEAIDQSRQSQLLSQKYHVTQKVFADLLIGVGTIGLIGFGASQVMGVAPENRMQPGDFIAFFWYFKMLYPTVLDLMSGFAKLAKATAGVERVTDVLRAPGQEAVSPKQKRPDILGNLRFDRVSFRYMQGTPILKNISFEVRRGEVVAVVGPSGAGKSTMVNLVPRFLEPDLGHVYVDGVDAREIDLPHLRGAIGMAFQECFLFSSSILENLRYARPNATRQEIIDVAKRTGADEFITKLPEKYDTIVGDTGVSLSRGQKQLVTLTRAMLKNPRILILDEATASIDEAREAKIIPAILDFMRGKTTLMITHRPELLKHADRVLQIEEGRVLFFGSPDEFSAMNATTDQHIDLTDDPQQDPSTRSSGSWPAIGAILLAISVTLAGLIGPVPTAIAQDATVAPPQPQETAQPEAAEPAQVVRLQPLAGAGRFLALPNLSKIQASDLVELLIDRLQANLGYRQADVDVTTIAPLPPKDLLRVVHLTRQSPEGTRLLQLGYKSFFSQPAQLWVYGQTLGDNPQPNGDIAETEKITKELQAAVAEQKFDMTVSDLRSELIKLSYVDSGRCLAILKSLGYQVIEYTDGGKSIGKSQIIKPSAPVDPGQLPIILAMPGPDAVDLVGPAQAASGAFGLAITPSVASDLPNMTSAAPLMELMVLYDPANPKQFADVLRRIRRTVDLPAKQILIEAMVLEISSTGLQKLGIKWDLENPLSIGSDTDNVEQIKLGRLPSFDNGEEAVLDITVSDISNHWRAQLQALIRTGDAEILSRPSVLTLDSRQASIRVGEEIPVAKSFRGVSGGDFVQLDFAYIPIGILLNVRPRVTAGFDEVSMQIDGIVSAQVPGEDLIIRDNNDNELGRAPRISTRRVQTYTRVANNTPFIIGGLISKDNSTQIDKVPILGDIPIIKHAFRSTEVNTLKREVIIVITPYVLPEDQLVGRSLPKDEDAFDSFGNQLFRDAYRIRAEDVFDLSFLTENQQLKRMRRLANHIVRQNKDVGRLYPFSLFAGNHFPGESILVYRQMYEVIKRKKIDENVDPSRFIFFQPDDKSESGFRVTFLEKMLEDLADKRWAEVGEDEKRPKDVFEAMQGKAVAMTFTAQKFSDDAGTILRQPVADVQVLDTPDRDAWNRLLWDLNQPDEQGRERRTLLLRSQDDLTRLKRALLLKHTVSLNVTEGSLTLDNFRVGRLLLMPTVKEEKVYLIDGDVAKYFFYTEQYYPALQKRLYRDIEALKEALRDPEYAQYLRYPDAVEQPIQWSPNDE